MENTQLFFNKCLDGNEFEQWLVDLLQGYGFKAWRTKKGGEGDGGDDNEGGDTVAKPTIVGDAGLDISQPIEISGAGNKTVRVKINTPGKLASLVVKITSSTLEALLPAVGLTSEFDICDEGLKETLSKLGLSATKGATSTTFDISSFMPMIAGLGGGDYLFTITATDQLGQKASKTLTVRNLND